MRSMPEEKQARTHILLISLAASILRMYSISVGSPLEFLAN